jgi:AAA+ ATPase superfamily predicted ATPase
MEKITSENPINIVFTGAPRAGKTTMIKNILKQYGYVGIGPFHSLVVKTNIGVYRVNLFDEVFCSKFGKKHIVVGVASHDMVHFKTAESKEYTHTICSSGLYLGCTLIFQIWKSRRWLC